MSGGGVEDTAGVKLRARESCEGPFEHRSDKIPK